MSRSNRGRVIVISGLGSGAMGDDESDSVSESNERGTEGRSGAAPKRETSASIASASAPRRPRPARFVKLGEKAKVNVVQRAVQGSEEKERKAR